MHVRCCACLPRQLGKLTPRCRIFSTSAKQTLEVAFSSGERYSYPAEYLRVHSEAACASSAPVAGRREVGIMGIAPVGNYGVRLEFDDLHHTGIYTW